MRFLSNFGCKIIFVCSVNFWHQQDSNSVFKGSIGHVTSQCKWPICVSPGGSRNRDSTVLAVPRPHRFFFCTLLQLEGKDTCQLVIQVYYLFTVPVPQNWETYLDERKLEKVDKILCYLLLIHFSVFLGFRWFFLRSSLSLVLIIKGAIEGSNMSPL